MTSPRRRTSLVDRCFLAAVVVIGCFGSASAQAAEQPAAVTPGKSLTPEQVTSRRSEAYERQKQHQWCEAQMLWRQLLSDLPQGPVFERDRKEAELNLQLLEPLCRPKLAPVAERSLPKPTAPPEKVSREHLLKYYPAGKKVRSRMDLSATGTGVNRDWIFQGQSNFAYQYKVVAESVVKSNTGSELLIEVWFQEVSQVRAVSDKELELWFPDSPLLGIVWNELEADVLRHVPVYVLAKKIADIGLQLDPRGKRTLTEFAKRLERFGVELDNSDQIDLLARLGQFDGVRLEVEYVSGFGVSKVKVLDGEKFAPDDLDRIAYNLSLLLDFYIFPGAEKQPGQRWDVRAQDVIGLLSFGHEIEGEGRLTLERGVDRRTADGETRAVLKLVSGEVILKDPRFRRPDATIVSRSGVVDYSPADLLVREARIAWGAGTA